MLYNLVNINMYDNIYCVEEYNLKNDESLIMISNQCNYIRKMYTIKHEMDKSLIIKNSFQHVHN